MQSLGRTVSGRGVLGSLPAVIGGTAAMEILDPFGNDDTKKRRRRKRALTMSDKNDIAFIAATLGETTGRKFALLIASRS